LPSQSDTGRDLQTRGEYGDEFIVLDAVRRRQTFSRPLVAGFAYALERIHIYLPFFFFTEGNHWQRSSDKLILFTGISHRTVIPFCIIDSVKLMFREKFATPEFVEAQS